MPKNQPQRHPLGDPTNLDSVCSNDDRNFFGCVVRPNPELVAEGWEWRFVGDARMARDAQETYGELGFDVKLEPIAVEGLSEECSGCKTMLAQFRAVYTRKRDAK